MAIVSGLDAVIPAKAGIQFFKPTDWIPAFAGMTIVFLSLIVLTCGVARIHS